MLCEIDEKKVKFSISHFSNDDGSSHKIQNRKKNKNNNKTTNTTSNTEQKYEKKVEMRALM